MAKIYYNINNLGEYTNNLKLAQLKVRQGDWENFGESDEEFVMQSDGSGYVKKSEYIEQELLPTPPSTEEQIAEIQETLLTLMGMGE